MLPFMLLLRYYRNYTSTGLQALSIKAQYEAAIGNTEQQDILIDQLKSLASSHPSIASVQLTAAQACLAAGETAAAYQFLMTTSLPSPSPEMIACKIQLLLKIDRLDLAQRELQLLQRLVGEESVLVDLCSIYIYCITGKSMANDAEHMIQALSEQYGPSPYLCNLWAVALAVQGDSVGAEAKLQECVRDASATNEISISQYSETLVNLVTVTHQQLPHKVAEANSAVQQVLSLTPPTPCSIQFATNYERVVSAYDREAAKYKV
jgi:Coatomer epsilon subunit